MKSSSLLLALACLWPLLVQAASAAIKITSPDFSEGGMIPARFTCDGANVNPRLDISGVPAGARSLVLIVDDPDAPAGTWNHWLLWNISPATTTIAAGSVPSGAIRGRSDFGQEKYIGPSPPPGTHRRYSRSLLNQRFLCAPCVLCGEKKRGGGFASYSSDSKAVGLFNVNFSSEARRRSTFFTSSAGGKDSGRDAA